MFVVFDLDGTLADNSHRIHHIAMPATPEHEWPVQDWAAYNAVCHLDGPIWPILNVARTLIEAGDRVEIWTGRDDATRAETLDWLRKHGVGVGHVSSFMRPIGDYTKDHDLKARWLAERGKPDLVFEDRARMVQFYRSHGILTCQVAEGNF